MVKERELLKFLRNLLEEVTQKYDKLVESKDRRMRELFQAATKDSLTSLYNRYYLHEFLKSAIARVQREKELGKKLALIFLDVDGFKQVNDFYGHATGDNLLKEIATFFQREVRGSDLIARFGGDEFTLVFEGIDLDLRKIKERMEELRNKFSRTFRHYNISFSYGTAIFPDEVPFNNSSNVDEILKQMISTADYRMYKDKKLRKSSWRERWSVQS